jgi:hypothetical protein
VAVEDLIITQRLSSEQGVPSGLPCKIAMDDMHADEW